MVAHVPGHLVGLPAEQSDVEAGGVDLFLDSGIEVPAPK